MESLIKKVLYTGVGLVATTTERLQKVVDELIEKGKLSREEGKKVVDDVVKNSEEATEEYEGRFRKVLDSALSRISLPKNKDYEKLEKRIKALEVKLDLLSKEIKEEETADA